MPENTDPVPAPSPEAHPGEFDFAAPVADTPRVKRRSLKPASGVPSTVRDMAREAPPRTSKDTTPNYVPDPRSDGDVEHNAKVKLTEPEPAKPVAKPAPTAKAAQPYTRPPSPNSSSTSKPTSSTPHGTRPATLYYASGAVKEKEPASPMKTTPSASTSPASSTPATPTRTAASTSASSVRPTSVVDYRTNVERQSREQKSVGDILSILVYSLIGVFVVGAILAGYGAFVVSEKLQQQSMTVAELDRHYAAETKDLNTKLANNLETLMSAQSDIARQQELIVKQQETINKLLAAEVDNASAIAREKQVRADEAASLRVRLKNLEYRGPGTSTQRY